MEEEHDDAAEALQSDFGSGNGYIWAVVLLLALLLQVEVESKSFQARLKSERSQEYHIDGRTGMI